AFAGREEVVLRRMAVDVLATFGIHVHVNVAWAGEDGIGIRGYATNVQDGRITRISHYHTRRGGRAARGGRRSRITRCRGRAHHVAGAGALADHVARARPL